MDNVTLTHVQHLSGTCVQVHIYLWFVFPPIFHVLIIIYSSGTVQCLSTVYFSDRRGTVTLFAGSFVCSPFHMMAFLQLSQSSICCHSLSYLNIFVRCFIDQIISSSNSCYFIICWVKLISRNVCFVWFIMSSLCF